MKRKIIQTMAVILMGAMATSCYTTYDAYGRPVQSVDPGTATAAALAAGVAGYAIGRDRDDRHHHHHRYRYHRW
jgi:hypothetical protein